ncbi:hypothetical protein RDWZM_005863 [Blomia tropicalis]|uniref:cGMP-dependent protein kinase interacting domain-containing protein n=1 Tax=Blomia tropicalis TaxID=40697 RepID=A0A9Q0M603_BLOTA|nr:hypothetical protein RDWZM_005863 [Blomia tropicalis]
MSFGPLGWRSTSSSSKNPRLAGLGKSTGSSSNRLSLATSSPISRSLTSLPFGGSAVDQYIASASNYSSTPTYRRSPHVRRGSSSQPSSTANRLRASSHTNISSLPNNSSTQTYAVIGLLILSFSPSNTTRSRTTSRPISNASSTTSLNSTRSGIDSEDNQSVASLDSVDSCNAATKTQSKSRYSNDSGYSGNGKKYSTSSLSESELRDIQLGNVSSDDIDYKKLCHQLIRENEQLRRRIKELEEAEKKREQEFGREKRSLQRTISEHEEELKTMNDIKADNIRLKDENAALIRVISKLSK